MSAEIRDINEKKPWHRGTARCLGCRHEWQQVTQDATAWFECSKCGRDLGRLVGHFKADSGQFIACPCGNDLFRFETVGWSYCPVCGERGPDFTPGGRAA